MLFYQHQQLSREQEEQYVAVLKKRMIEERSHCVYRKAYGIFQIDFAQSINPLMTREQVQKLFETGEVLLPDDAYEDHFCHRKPDIVSVRKRSLRNYVEVQNAFKAINYMLDRIDEPVFSEFERCCHEYITEKLELSAKSTTFYKAAWLEARLKQLEEARKKYAKAVTLDELIEAFCTYEETGLFNTVNHILFLKCCFDLKIAPPSFKYYRESPYTRVEWSAEILPLERATIKKIIIEAQNIMLDGVIPKLSGETIWFEDAWDIEFENYRTTIPEKKAYYAEKKFNEWKELVWMAYKNDFSLDATSKLLGCRTDTAKLLLQIALEEEVKTN